MWDKGVEGDAEGNQEDGEGGGDLHEHKTKTDVQGQNDGQNVRDDNGDSKDNDN